MMSRITINNVDDDIADVLRQEGLSRLGPKYLKAAHILDQSGILQHLLLMYDNGQHEKTSLLDIIEKAVGIGRIIEGDQQVTATSTESTDSVPVVEQKAPTFGV